MDLIARPSEDLHSAVLRHDDLDDLDIDASYLGRFSIGSRERLLGSGSPVEHDVTQLLAALTGNAMRVLVEALTSSGGAAPAVVEGVEIEAIRVGEVVDRRRGDRRAPDFALCATERAADGRPTRTVTAVIELKRPSAMVNGGVGYCPEDPHGYSNQVICYAHDCWTAATLDHVQRYWIGARRHQEDPRGGITGVKGIHDGDGELFDARSRQDEAEEEHWHFLAIEDLIAAFEHAGDPTSLLVADALQRIC